MAIDKAIKKKIIEGWQRAFPQLTAYAQDKLYKRVGPLIIGLELVKLPRSEEYRPYFVIYALWGNKMGSDVKACLSGPIMLIEYTNKKGLQFNLPYEKDSALSVETVENIRQQTPLRFYGDISLNEIFFVFDKYSMKPPLSAAPNSYLQAMLQESKLKVALYVSVTEAQRILEEINKRSWDVNHFRIANNDVSEWRESLQKQIDDREAFLNRIEVNEQDGKILKLENSSLIA